MNPFQQSYPWSIPHPSSLVEYMFLSTDDSKPLNWIIRDPGATTVLRILSNDSYSVLQNGTYAIVGTIDWRGRFPRVELPNTLPSVEARRWLSLSPDLSRSMTFQGRKYRWVPEGEHVNMYLVDQPYPVFAGRIRHGGNGTFVDLTPGSIDSQILHAVVAAAVILLSGRFID